MVGVRLKWYGKWWLGRDPGENRCDESRLPKVLIFPYRRERLFTNPRRTEPVPTSTIRPRSLVRRALASDLVDRLTAPHGVDRYLELIDPSWTVRPDRGGSTDSDGSTLPTLTVIPEAPSPGETDAGSAATAAETGVVISFARSQLTAPVDGTLLTTAEAAGLTPKNRCRRGICGTCTTHKLSGATRNSITGETSDEPRPIRICVTEPCGDDVTLDL